tara:strand:+ start:424 stop:1050 length:627 start_codon:yes stop_codon:yes gene_type:complete
VNKVFKKLKILGYQNFCFCFFSKIYLKIISLFFNVNKWHVNTPYYCRTYKIKVVEIVNNLNPNIVFEIGCGIGDIINKITSDVRVGIDIDENIINLAKFLNKKTIFQVGSFNNIKNFNENKKIDVIIAVNWLHGIESKLISQIFKNLDKDVISKYIIVDQLKKSNDKQYSHRFDEILGNKYKRFLTFEKDGDETRNILVFKNKIFGQS